MPHVGSLPPWPPLIFVFVIRESWRRLVALDREEW
jgi:hypothetical protein